MREEALLLGKTRSLVGILTDPPEAKRSTRLPGIILLNAGIIHRVGPNRMHVKIARTLAPMGFVVVRFDFSGIGDSI
ncbi:MAG: alpha/beta hydrolase, partial [Candidatus Binatia bacterium]